MDKLLLIYIGQQCPFNVHRYDESSHPVTNFEFLSLDSQQLDYKTLKTFDPTVQTGGKKAAAQLTLSRLSHEMENLTEYVVLAGIQLFSHGPNPRMSVISEVI